MYDITTIPVPYHMNDELIDETESKYTYTKIKPSTEILAMGRSQSDQSELQSTCTLYSI